MNQFYKITALLCVVLFLLQSCGGGADQKALGSKADSLFIKVRCIKTVTELIEKSLLLPAQKKLQYKIDYINETWPDTLSPAQAQKILMIKDTWQNYQMLISAMQQLQKQSGLQLEQVNKLSADIGKGRGQNMLQYLTFEGRCADTLNSALDTLIKKAIQLGCISQNIN